MVGNTKGKGWSEKTGAPAAAEGRKCLTAVAQGCGSGTSRSAANIDVKTQQPFTILVETNILYIPLGDAVKYSFRAVTFFFGGGRGEFIKFYTHLERQNPGGTFKK